MAKTTGMHTVRAKAEKPGPLVLDWIRIEAADNGFTADVSMRPAKSRGDGPIEYVKPQRKVFADAASLVAFVGEAVGASAESEDEEGEDE